jgi:hypothetical protein
MEYMLNYDVAFVDKLTGFNEKKRVGLIEYYNEVLEDKKIKIHEDLFDFSKKNKLRRIKGKEAEYNYSMFMLSIDALRNKDTGKGEDYKFTESQLKGIERLKKSKRKYVIEQETIQEPKPRKPRKSPLRMKVSKRYMDEIRTLKEVEGLSWRKISLYMKTYHSLSISYSYAKKLYDSLTSL